MLTPVTQLRTWARCSLVESSIPTLQQLVYPLSGPTTLLQSKYVLQHAPTPSICVQQTSPASCAIWCRHLQLQQVLQAALPLAGGDPCAVSEGVCCAVAEDEGSVTQVRVPLQHMMRRRGDMHVVFICLICLVTSN
jgi:hypothetical protein